MVSTEVEGYDWATRLARICRTRRAGNDKEARSPLVSIRGSKTFSDMSLDIASGPAFLRGLRSLLIPSAVEASFRCR